jgi:hypothetical protein
MYKATSMSLSYGSEHRWRHMATVEVGCDVVDFAGLIRDDTLRFQVERAGKSPPGSQWFLLFMDLSGGERRAARTAWAVLTALKGSAAAGFISEFRIVEGQQWLGLGNASEDKPACATPTRHLTSAGRHGEGGMACA